MGVTTSAFAGTQIDELKDRITALENSASAIEFGGVIEMEYGKSNPASGVSTDETSLATVELSAAAAINDNFDAELVLLYEQDENNNNIAVDVATLNGHMQIEGGNLAFSVGRMYVPFGVYETAAISDPYGLEVGETQDEAILLSAEFENGVSAAIWSANNSGTSDNSGISLAYEADDFAIGIDTIDHVAGANTEKGLALHGSVSLGDFTIIAEQISEREGANKAKATQLEVDYAVGDWSFAAVNNSIDNEGDYDNINSFAAGYALAEGAGIAVEYSVGDRTDNTGDDKTITVQLAYEF